MNTYKPTNNTTANYGEQSQAVLDLQNKLNSLGAGLALDSKYGPKTQEAYNKYQSQLNAPVAPVSQPINTSLTELGFRTQDQIDLDNARRRKIDYDNQLSNQDIDEEQIRRDTLRGFQSEIDALNNVYADKLSRAKVEGQGRLGTTGAVNARRGLLGSDFGNATTDRVNAGNEEIYGSIEAEKQAKISELLRAASDEGSKAIEAKRLAKNSSLKDYIQNLSEATNEATKRAGTVAAGFLNGGYDIDDESMKGVLEQAAQNAGVDVKQIKEAYKLAKQTQDKAAEEAAKEGQFNLSEGQARYDANGKLIAQRGKTYAPKAGTGAGGGTGAGDAYGTDLEAIIGTVTSTIPSKFGQETFRTQISRSRNDADKINLVAAQILKQAPATDRSDFKNQTLGIANLDKAISELDKGAKTGFINNAGQYVFNIAGKDFDPKLTAIKQYLVSAIQPYRNSVTGAAWGEQEEAEYQSLFGSTKYSPKELKDRLTRMKEILKSKTLEGLNSYVNPLNTYDNQFTYGSGSSNNNTGGGNIVIAPDGTQIEIID